MRQRLSRIAVFLLIVAVVVAGLASCTRQADEREVETTASPASTEVVETPPSGAAVTPAPANTHVAAVTTTPEESSTLTQVPPAQPTEQASGAAPTAGAEPEASPSPSVSEEASVTEVHVVVEGETLTAIATRYGTSVAILQELNNIEDPESIQAGQELELPPEDSSSVSPTRPPDCRLVYQVKKGDTLLEIAEKYGVKLSDVKKANKIKDRNKIYPSMTLCIP